MVKTRLIRIREREFNKINNLQQKKKFSSAGETLRNILDEIDMSREERKRNKRIRRRIEF